MIGIDTNVIIRYLVQDDKAQARRASHLMERELTPQSPGFINLTTLCEIVWVLCRSYKVDKTSQIQILDGLLTTKQLVVEDVAVAWKALRAYEVGNADFSDAIIAQVNAKYGCEKTVTFDKKAGKLECMELMS